MSKDDDSAAGDDYCHNESCNCSSVGIRTVCAVMHVTLALSLAAHFSFGQPRSRLEADGAWGCRDEKRCIHVTTGPADQTLKGKMRNMSKDHV